MIDSFLIIDEYDSFFFDNSNQNNMKAKFDIIKGFRHVIGLSGSTLNKCEASCLDAAFNTIEVKFPHINKFTVNQILHKQDMIL